jgi:hypothetical protein
MGQVLHKEKPEPENVPAWQVVHDDDPADADVPAWQFSHVSVMAPE